MRTDFRGDSGASRPLRRRWFAWSLIFMAAACSVADNLSYEEIVTEMDGIVTIVGQGTERSIQYAERAPVSAWYVRQPWLVPVRWVLGQVFGYRHMSTIDNPAGHVRDLLRELPDEMGSDLLDCAQATLRFGWIAELDGNGNSRVVALDGLAAVARNLELGLFDGSFADLVAYADPARLAAARIAVQAGRPQARTDQAVSDAQLQEYRTALALLVERPLADWSHRLIVVRDLVEILLEETDAECEVATELALRAAIGHCVREILLRTVASRDPKLVEVRLCAMEQVRRLGGPRIVPLLLAVMAATPEQLARSEPRFDSDPLVQLRLIQYCGQLRGELAETEVRLPGRDNLLVLSPVEFLAQVVLNEQAYYSKLRTPAMAALSLTLGKRHFDPDPAWVREWYRERPRGT